MKKKSLIITLCIILTAIVITCIFIPWNKVFKEEEPFVLTEADLVRIDSSTGASPLTIAVASAAMNIELKEDAIKSSKTVQAVKNVINGERDIAVVPYPSKEVLEEALKANVELETILIANNAFVFLVNKDNPVNNLTSEQIKQIYSGKITNWKEVGGEDKNILPIQRNKDSGSQTAMVDFMGNTELLTPLQNYEIGTMGELVDAINTPFDASSAAIGYSYYYYVSNMYIKDSIKLLSLDGIKPSKNSIIDGTYPQISPYYAVIRKSSPKDSMERKLIDFILSKKGQKAIEDTGYIGAKLK